MFRPLRTGVLLALAATLALGFDFSILKPQGPVSDYAHVLDARARAGLARYCSAVEEATGAEIALVTIDSLHGEPIEDVANLLYRKWGVGSEETDEGLLLLLAIEDRQSRLEVGHGLQPHIPDGYSGSLLRDMRDDLRAGDYAGALGVAAQTLGTRIAAAKGVSLQASPPRRRTPARGSELPWGAGGRTRASPVLSLVRGRARSPGWAFRAAARVAVRQPFRAGIGTVPTDVPPAGSAATIPLDSFGGFGGGDSGGGGRSTNW